MSYTRRHSTNVCPGNRVRYTLTDEEKGVLKELERRINTMAFVVSRIAKRTFNEEDREEHLDQALADCDHDLGVVQHLD